MKTAGDLLHDNLRYMITDHALWRRGEFHLSAKSANCPDQREPFGVAAAGDREPCTVMRESQSGGPADAGQSDCNGNNLAGHRNLPLAISLRNRGIYPAPATVLAPDRNNVTPLPAKRQSATQTGPHP